MADHWFLINSRSRVKVKKVKFFDKQRKTKELSDNRNLVINIYEGWSWYFSEASTLGASESQWN